MDEVAIDDLRTYFVGTIVLYKGKPCKVRSINEDKVYRITNLMTGKTASIQNAHKDILPPARRLGMVNICDSVMYVSRIPYRRYQIGINSQNVQVRPLAGASYPEGKENTKDVLRTFEGQGIAKCMLNDYPTFEEAIQLAKETGGCWAFDKQFAVDDKQRIYYRTTSVGVIAANKKSQDDIQFLKEYRHLSFLLGEPYEKDFSNLGQAFA